MSGTAITQAANYNAFRDGQAQGSIPPAAVRNLIASNAFNNTTKQVFRPEFAPYLAVFDGVTDNTTAISNMFADITTAGGGFVVLPQGVCIVRGGTLKIPNYTTIIGQGFGDDGSNAGSVFRRKTGSAGAIFSTVGTTDSLQTISVVLMNFAVESDGGSTSGPGIQWFYGTKCFTQWVRVFGFQDSGWQIVASQDSVWSQNMLFWCGQGGTGSNGATIGQSAILISGGTASSGLGASANGCNNLDFIANRIEQFSAEGVSIQKNLGTATTSCSQIRFWGNKFETTILGGAGTNNYMIAMSGDVRSIHFSDTYVAMDVATGSIGFIVMIYDVGYADIVFRDTKCWIGTAGQVYAVIQTAPGVPSTCWVDGLTVDGTTGQLFGLNSGSMFYNSNPSGGLVPYRNVQCLTASTGTQFNPAYPPAVAPLQTTQTLTGNGQTITPGIYNSVVVATASSRTGTILANGSSGATDPTQYFTVLNSSASNTVAFSASVFGSPTLAAGVSRIFAWDATNSIWR